MVILKQICLLILICLFWGFVFLAKRVFWIFYIPAVAVVGAVIYILFFFGKEYNPVTTELPKGVYLQPIPGDSLYGTCPNCGTKNKIGNQTCRSCRTPLKETLEEGREQ